MSTWHNRQGGEISHLVDNHGEILATVIREGSAYNPIYIIKGRLAVGLEGRIFISMQAAQSAVKPEPAAPAAQGEEVVDRVAKAIADAAGHGMREKCEHLAHAAIAAYKLATWGTAPPAQPAEPPHGSDGDESYETSVNPTVRAAYADGYDVGYAHGKAAQPAERVPEGFRSRLLDTLNLYYAKGKAGASNESATDADRLVALLAATPAPSPARGDGGDV